MKLRYPFGAFAVSAIIYSCHPMWWARGLFVASFVWLYFCSQKGRL